jgi:hypothetical protein
MAYRFPTKEKTKHGLLSLDQPKYSAAMMAYHTLF